MSLRGIKLEGVQSLVVTGACAVQAFKRGLVGAQVSGDLAAGEPKIHKRGNRQRRARPDGQAYMCPQRQYILQ